MALWAKLLVRLALAHLAAIGQRLRRHRVLIRAQTNMADGGAVSAAWPRHTQAAAVSAVLQNYTQIARFSQITRERRCVCMLITK